MLYYGANKMLFLNSIVFFFFVSQDFAMEKKQIKKLERSKSYNELQACCDSCEAMGEDIKAMQAQIIALQASVKDLNKACLALKQNSNENRLLYLKTEKSATNVLKDNKKQGQQIEELKALFELLQFQINTLESESNKEAKNSKKTNKLKRHKLTKKKTKHATKKSLVESLFNKSRDSSLEQPVALDDPEILEKPKIPNSPRDDIAHLLEEKKNT